MLASASLVGVLAPLRVLSLAILVLAVADVTGSGRSGVAKVGPAHSWLVRVPPHEAAAIARRCSTRPSPHSGDTNSTAAAINTTPQASPQQRIIDGERAPFGSFKYAAAMTLRRRRNYSETWAAACGATFVSRQHLLTAAHCASDPAFSSRKLSLQVGGVCLNAERSDDCHGAYLTAEAEVNFIISPYYYHTQRQPLAQKELAPDLAIIQLSGPLVDDGTFESACLPAPDDALPQYLTAYGWGSRGDAPAEEYPDRLRYVEVSTQPLPEWTPGFGEMAVCQPTRSKRFCLFAVHGRKNGTVYYGDSGSGLVWPSLSEQGPGVPVTLYGVNSIIMGINISLNEAAGEPREVRIMGVDTSVGSHLAELCYYTGLCGNDGAMRGTRMSLRFGSVYMNRLRSAMPALGSFALITDDEDERNRRSCDDRAATYGGHVPPSDLMPDFTWAAVLVDTAVDGEDAPRLVCTATLVSSHHLLVARYCVVEYMMRQRRTESTTIDGKTTLPRLQVTFEVSGSPKTLYPVEFVAWLLQSAEWKGDAEAPESSELAVVQLQSGEGGEPPLDVGIHHPTCPESEPNPNGYGYNNGSSAVPAVAYWYTAETMEMRREVRSDVVMLNGKFVSRRNPPMPSDLLIVTQPTNVTAIDLESIYGHSGGLVDTRNYYLLGIGVYRRPPRHHVYLHAWEYSGTLCLYLNVGCRPSAEIGASFVDNRVPYFNRFVYFD